MKAIPLVLVSETGRSIGRRFGTTIRLCCRVGFRPATPSPIGLTRSDLYITLDFKHEFDAYERVIRGGWSVKIAKLARIGGRALLAALFILAGIAKALDGTPFLAHMAEHGVPGLLLPAVIVLEIGAGIAVLIGWRLMISAGSLGVFCLLTALLFHNNLGDHVERSAFFKDLALAGALTVIAAGAFERSA